LQKTGTLKISRNSLHSAKKLSTGAGIAPLRTCLDKKDGLFQRITSRGFKMNKLIATLVAGLFSVSAFAASHSSAPAASAAASAAPASAMASGDASAKPAKAKKAKKEKKEASAMASGSAAAASGSASK
jgi:hypothetical protein